LNASYRDALQKAGKPHVFVGYQRERHGLEDPQHRIDWFDRLESFLQMHNPAQ
jgi:dipeptidyl aminopeptidase/acylaminoacyl peptidase